MLVKYVYPWGFFAPPQSGADAVAVSHLDYFRARHWDVEFITVRVPGMDRSEAAFRARYPWVKIVHVIDFPSAPFTLADQLLAYAAVARRPAVRAALARPADLFVSNYVFTAPLAPLVLAGCPKVLETVDVISDQLRLRSLQAPDGPPRVPSVVELQREYLLRVELDLYRLFDATVMITREELAVVARAGAANAHFVPRYVAAKAPVGTGPDSRYDLLFVGSKFRPNRDGLDWFYRHVYVPYLWRRGVKLAVAGRICEWFDFADRYVTRLGTVDGPLDPLYAASKVVVAPVFEGTGISIKAAEAVAMGKALVAAPAAARGLDTASGALIVSDMKADPAATADTLLELIDNPLRRRVLEERAAAYARREFGWEVFAAAMDRVFDPLLRNGRLPARGLRAAA